MHTPVAPNPRPLSTNLMDTWLVENHHKVRVNLGESSVEDRHFGDLFPDAAAYLEMRELTLGNNSTWGSSRLREEIAATYSALTSRNVLVTAGVSEALIAVCMAHYEPGANMVIPVPAFHALFDVPETLGFEVRRVPLSAADHFRLPKARLLAALDERTRIVLLNSPHNPTGRVYEQEEILEIAAAARAVGATLVVDEHYRYLPRNAAEQWIRSAAGGADNIVTLGSVGKCFGCTGIRVGWITAGELSLERYHSFKLLITHTIPVISDRIAVEVLQRKQELLAVSRDHIARNLGTLALTETQCNGEMHLYVPDAGSVAYVELMSIRDTFAFAQKLLEASGVLVLPGESFEMPGFLRLRLGVAPEQFADACGALKGLVEREKVVSSTHVLPNFTGCT